jgi:hypothetical protein
MYMPNWLGRKLACQCEREGKRGEEKGGAGIHGRGTEGRRAKITLNTSRLGPRRVRRMKLSMLSLGEGAKEVRSSIEYMEVK